MKLKRREGDIFGYTSYFVYDDGQLVGLVGNVRPWRDGRFGRRRWWACERREGDRFARWDSGDVFTTRKAAVTALSNRLGE